MKCAMLGCEKPADYRWGSFNVMKTCRRHTPRKERVLFNAIEAKYDVKAPKVKSHVL